MKKLLNSISPFVLLLIPVIILVTLMSANTNSKIATRKGAAFKILKMPVVSNDGNSGETNKVKFTENSISIFF